jgi:hypothetical protein
MVKQKNIETRSPNFEKYLFFAHRALIIVLCSILIMLGSQLYAQHINVSARVDSHNVLIGDWIKLYIEVEYPNDVKLNWPQITDSLKNIEIIERTSPTIERTDKTIKEKIIFTTTIFDTGTHIIPPLDFTYKKLGAQNQLVDTTEFIVSTNPIPIFVHSVGIDTSQEIKDIKPPLSVPITFGEILPYLIGILFICILVYLIYFFRKKRKKGVFEIFEAPKRPAHEIALEALLSLESEKLWQRGEVKQFHSKLSDIVRTYLENRYYIRAMESTTGEILEDLYKMNLNGTLTASLFEMLTIADLVKFAKRQPLPDENQISLNHAYNFVRQTIPKIQTNIEEAKV